MNKFKVGDRVAGITPSTKGLIGTIVDMSTAPVSKRNIYDVEWDNPIVGMASTWMAYESGIRVAGELFCTWSGKHE